jgi:hypothetical protein
MMEAEQFIRTLAFNPNFTWPISKDISVNHYISSTWFKQVRPIKTAGFLINT